jgi:hypothetical protein
MDGVDCGDQYRECGSGFAKKAHFKKWYKKAYFAVLDFMLLNGFFTWNMAAENPDLHRLKVKKHQFYAALAKEMIAYVDNKDHLYSDEEEEVKATGIEHEHQLAIGSEHNYCVVCRLEEKWRDMVGKKDRRTKHARRQDHMAVCTNVHCRLHAHSTRMDHDRRIFNMDCFKGKSCFEIAHSRE